MVIGLYRCCILNGFSSAKLMIKSLPAQSISASAANRGISLSSSFNVSSKSPFEIMQLAE
jgi:hypothetical protein